MHPTLFHEISLLAHARMIRNHLIEDAQARAEFDQARASAAFRALMGRMGVLAGMKGGHE